MLLLKLHVYHIFESSAAIIFVLKTSVLERKEFNDKEITILNTLPESRKKIKSCLCLSFLQRTVDNKERDYN